MTICSALNTTWAVLASHPWLHSEKPVYVQPPQLSCSLETERNAHFPEKLSCSSVNLVHMFTDDTTINTFTVVPSHV